MVDPNTYHTRLMASWDGVDADLLLTDPPFGIDFDGTNETYNRHEGRVFDPLAGAGTAGIAAEWLDREYVLGDANENAREVYEQTKDALGDNSSGESL